MGKYRCCVICRAQNNVSGEWRDELLRQQRRNAAVAGEKVEIPHPPARPVTLAVHKSTGARFGRGLCHSIGLYHCGNGFPTFALFVLPVVSFSGGLAVSTRATSCFWYGRTQASLCVALSLVVVRSLPRPATHMNVALVDITLRTCCYTAPRTLTKVATHCEGDHT